MGSRLVLMLLFLTVFVHAEEKRSISRIVDTVEVVPPSNKKLGATIALSIIPGGGQIYQGDYIHGGLFLGFEALFGTIAINRWQTYHNRLNQADSIRFNFNTMMSASTVDTNAALDTLFSLHKKEYDALSMKMLHRNYSAWFTGLYVWNMFDAFGYSGIVRGVEKPRPRRAAALSAIPFLGLGQLYNGRRYKAGLVWAMQIGCFTSAINFQRLMNESQDREAIMKEHLLYSSDAVSLSKTGSMERYWESSYESATRSRTMFMWYGVIFYFYGIIDAYVDAHLHGFERKFDIVGGFNPFKEEVQLSLTYDFGKRKRK